MSFAKNIFPVFSAEFRYLIGLNLSFTDLKQLGRKCATRGDARLYERLIGKYDPQLKLPSGFQFERFVGFNGKGENTLDSFRVLRSGELNVFEKFYQNGSVDWVKVSFFMNYHAGEIDPSRVYIPKMINSASGEGLVVSHSEYVTVLGVGPSKYFDVALTCIDELSRLRLNPSAPELLFDIMLHAGFARCYRKSLGFAKEFGMSLEVYQRTLDRVLKMQRFVAHGDLSVKNMSAPCYVFDWDNFGYYPPGFDLALCLVKAGSIASEGSVADFSRRYYPLYSSGCTVEDFYLALLFFCVVFTGNRNVPFKKALLESLQEALSQSEAMC
ncbi:MAG: aminoglycoside phosphotransferase family protein [Gammaproteobacteria bacterium]|nr:aminoglycoside phosphotransferase family protein [Gammaproteobacteria bacterium]